MMDSSPPMSDRMRKVSLGLLAPLALAVALIGCAANRTGTDEVTVSVGGDPLQSEYAREISPLFASYCGSCHSGGSPAAAVSLAFPTLQAARDHARNDDEFWVRVVRNLSTGVMPPAQAPRRPSDGERERLISWIETNLLTTDGRPDPGPFVLRRLNNREYENTIRDLLYLPADYDVVSDFPADERGDGFDNNASTLTISPLLIEHYLAAAERATVFAMGLDPDAPRDQSAASRRALNAPTQGMQLDFADWQERARVNLETFAPRAFRRAVTSEEIDELMRFAALSFAHDGESQDAASALAFRAALLSPEFLFRAERDPNPDGTGKVYELTEYQLASRLSYFLWSSMPDDSLYMAARDGTLRSDLESHLRRMLSHPRANSLTKDFLGQWLEIRSLHEATNVDPILLAAMQGETEHFFDYIVREDRSIMELLDADYTFMNETLAQHYGVEGVQGEAFQKVLVDRTRRGGIFTHASFLTLSSKPLGDSRRTSPVVRGKYIIENLFNETVPPPPPDVPEIEFDANKELFGTVRQIFEQHRVDPSCAGCHARMDPYGFALENYDGYGRWRDLDNGVVVDASGEINGRAFTTPVEFRAILADRQDDFREAIIRKMLAYALGRGVQGTDRAAVQEIVAKVKESGDTFSSLILSIASSYPFQHSRGSTGAEELPVDPSAFTYHPVKLPANSTPSTTPPTAPVSLRVVGNTNEEVAR